MTRTTIGLFYGSSTCYTEIVGEKIRAQIGEDQVDLFDIADHSLSKAESYDYLIFGIPTWDFGELQEDWEDTWDDINELNLRGKTAALYGLGDQIGYSEWFLDAMGYLHEALLGRGATIVGYWPVEGYRYEDSKALTPDKQHFVGLALDEENDFNLTDERITTWCQQIKQAFGLT